AVLLGLIFTDRVAFWRESTAKRVSVWWMPIPFLAAALWVATAQVSTMAAPRTLLSSGHRVVGTDPRDAAADWLAALPAGTTIGLTRTPWFFSPPVSPYNAGPQTDAAFRREAASNIVILPDEIGRASCREH